MSNAHQSSADHNSWREEVVCNGHPAETVNLTTIACIGAGYVGGPTCAVIALNCPSLMVYVVDKDQKKIEAWNSENLPCYEPGLSEVVNQCRGKNLFFTTDFRTVIENAQLIFISVNTPTKETGFGRGRAPDMQYIDACTRLIAEYAKSPKIVVEKSTVPVNAARLISSILNHSGSTLVSRSHVVLSNPEFLAEGTAMRDLLLPDRILIGGPSSDEGLAAIASLSSIYKQWVPEDRIITMNTWSAEMSKLVANAVLAQRISSMNTVSAICESSGADVDQVAKAVGMDSRIGPHFLKASLGFGGSCLEKDVLCLVYLAETLNMAPVADYWYQVVKINNWQKRRFAEMIVSSMFNSVAGKSICILGYAFKKDTADARSSAAVDICDYLLEEGASLSIYDPKVPKASIFSSLDRRLQAKDTISNSSTRSICVRDDAYSAAEQTHALVICTEWDEFQTLDYARIYKSMIKPAFVFDGRLLLDAEKLKSIGFLVYGIGR